jgi:two-component system, NarL family, sensor kinase
MNNLKNIYEQEILKARLEMQEQTFLNISQEIHDNIGQILSLVRLNICTIKPDDFASTAYKLVNSKELLDKAIEDLRNVSKRLNANYISQQSLSESLMFQLSLIQRAGLYETSIEVHGEERTIHAEKKLIIFRIVQEALNNIIKHAGAKTISVTVSNLPDKTILSIKDDGKGFLEEALMIETDDLSYRANLIGAIFNIQAKPGEGTVVQLILPVIS